MTYLIIIIDQCIVVITQTFKVDECNFVETAVIIGTKQLFTSMFLLYGMKINLSTDGQKRTTTSQHKENNNWRPTKNNYLTTQRKQSLATNKEQLPHSTNKTARRMCYV